MFLKIIYKKGLLFSTITLIIVLTVILFFTVSPQSKIEFFKQEDVSIEKPRAEELTILIGGDVMFDRHVRKLAQTNGYDSLLVPLKGLFKSADIVAVNLEGPVTSQPSKTLLPDGSTTNKLVFTFDPQAAIALMNAGISLVSLANNHTDNFGSSGFLETKSHLENAGIKYFGDPWNSSSTEAIITKNNIKVAFIGYHYFIPGFQRVLSEIRRLSKEVDFVIVVPHWGEEYEAIQSEDLRVKAQAMIAAGADAIVGAHAHVVAQSEWIGNVPVFYSLGNLLFDQYFSPEVMKGNLVELHLVKQGSTTLDRVRIYETSLKTRKNVTVTTGPMEMR